MPPVPTGQTEKIARWILDQIDSGTFGVGSKIPSEYELAEKFSVNKTTANKAVATLVAKGILKRGRGAAGTVVASVSTFPKGVLGICIGILGASSFALVLQGFQRRAFQRGYATQLYCAPQTDEIATLTSTLTSSSLQGMLVTHATLGTVSADYPIIYLNDIPQGIPENKLHVIRTGNREGGYLIGKHLLQLGHKQIVCTRQSEFSESLVERTKGVAQAMTEAELPEPAVYITGARREEMQRVVSQILSEHPQTTASACDGDKVSLTLIDVLRDQGIRVPEQISVTGFSNLEEMQRVLSITTIDDRAQDTGMLAADRLIDLLEGRASGHINERVVPHLQPGATTSANPHS